jgi:ELWxxDGT repeat protein
MKSLHTRSQKRLTWTNRAARHKEKELRKRLKASQNRPAMVEPLEDRHMLSVMAAATGTSDHDLSSFPSDMAEMAGTIYFSAETRDIGRELWKYTPGGNPPAVVKDINGGAETSDPSELTVVGSTLFFVAHDGAVDRGYELWKTDGTDAGTTRVSDFQDPQNHVSQLTAVGDVIFFTAYDADGYGQLWRCGESDTATSMVTVYSGEESPDPTELAEANGALYFSAWGNWAGKEEGFEPWSVSMEGTTPQLTRLEDVNATWDDDTELGESSSPHGFTAAGDDRERPE